MGKSLKRQLEAEILASEARGSLSNGGTHHRHFWGTATWCASDGKTFVRRLVLDLPVTPAQSLDIPLPSLRK